MGVHTWDLVKEQWTHILLKVPDSYVEGVAMNKGGSCIVSGSLDRKVIVWREIIGV